MNKLLFSVPFEFEFRHLLRFFRGSNLSFVSFLSFFSFLSSFLSFLSCGYFRTNLLNLYTRITVNMLGREILAVRGLRFENKTRTKRNFIPIRLLQDVAQLGLSSFPWTCALRRQVNPGCYAMRIWGYLLGLRNAEEWIVFAYVDCIKDKCK